MKKRGRYFTKLNRQMALSLILTLKLTLTLILTLTLNHPNTNPVQLFYAFFQSPSLDLQSSPNEVRDERLEEGKIVDSFR